MDGRHKKTKKKYDPNGFDIYYTHKDTDDIYDLNGFDINGRHEDTKNKYDPNGFDIKGIHRDTNTFLNKETDIRKDISKIINWLKDKNEFLKLYDEIIKNGEFRETINKKVISSNIFKNFLENILSRNIKDNEAEDYIKGINDIEKKLNRSKKGKKINNLKNYIKKIKKSVYEKDQGRVRTDKAKSFEDQKGKGHVDLPILLFKLNINSSKELISIIEQLFNILNRSMTYKNDS